MASAARQFRLIVGVAITVCSACGRQADTTPPSFGDSCSTDDDCKPPFTCIGGQASPHSCSKPCASDSDCPSYHWSPPCSSSIDTDVQSSCGDGYCHAFIACQAGWDGGTDFTQPISTLGPKRELGSLSAAEQDRLCADIVRYQTATLLPDECLHYAIQLTAAEAASDANTSDADLQAYCASRYVGCMVPAAAGSTAPGQDGASSGGPACDLSHVTASCGATVADEEQCLLDSDTMYRGVPGCSQVTRAVLTALSADGGLGAAAPASCAAVILCFASADSGAF